MQADKTASLNEHVLLEDRQEAEARQKARNAELAARKTPDVKIFELTVKKADDPGLPPPLGETNAATTINLPAGTNSTNITSTASSMAGNASKPLDPTLDEAERILEDYISLLSSKQILIAN